MKKFFSILTFLFLGGLFSSELWAYDLWVAGVQVTESNASNIKGDGISGTVTYDNSTKTLTLNGFIKGNETAGIKSFISGLKIVVHGSCSISTTIAHGIYCAKGTTIKSDNFSTLNINAKTDGYCGIWIVDGYKLIIEDMWLNVTGSLALFANGESDLQLNRCYVYASSSYGGYSCVHGFKSIGTQGVKYDYNGITFNATNKCLENSSGNIVKTHTMMPRISVGMYIWDVRNDAKITSDTPGSCMSAGTIYFDAGTRTLTMNGVQMSSGSFKGIGYMAPYGGGDLNIRVIGSNTISLSKGTSSEGIYSNDYGVNIYGENPDKSTLTINNTEGFGIFLDGTRTKTLSLKDLTLNVNSTTKRSIYGNYFSNLNIDNCAVTANYGISGFTECNLTACHPSSDVHFSTTLQSFTQDDEYIYNDVVRIYVGYELSVGGKTVTKSNQNNILGDGQFSYDPDKNVLTLKNAKLTTAGTCINNRIKDLTVEVVGPASLTSTANHGIYSTKNITLKSDTYADLSVSSTSSGSYCGLWLNGPGHLIIENLWLTATATYPIYGNGGTQSDGPELWVQYSNVTAKSTGGKSCIQGFNYLFRWSVTVNYDGSEYSTTNKCMYNSNGEILTSHTIKPYLSVKKYIINTYITENLNASSPGAGITNGKIQYKKDGTLILDGVTIDAEGYSGISYYGEEDLTVKVKGENAISSKSGGQLSPIYCNGSNITICGEDKSSSKLTLTNSNAPAIELEGENEKTLAIKDVNLHAAGTTAYYSLVGHRTTNLDINNCNVTLNRNMNVFKSCTMTRCDIVEPEGAYFSPKLGGFTTDGSSVYGGKVVIGDVSYGLLIGETWVNTSNAPDILGDGKFSYDAATKTLTVKDANIENMTGAQGSGIDNRRIDGLIIKHEGYSTITTRSAAIYSERPFSITGSGILIASTPYSSGLLTSGTCTKCIIDGPALVLNGENAIKDYNNITSLMVRGDKTYLALNPDEGKPAIKNLKELQLVYGQRIAKPEGAYFSTLFNALTLDGENICTGKAIICSGSLAEVNRDGTVDVADIGCIIDAMAESASPSIEVFADVNADGTIDVADIGTVIDEMAAGARCALNEK